MRAWVSTVCVLAPHLLGPSPAHPTSCLISSKSVPLSSSLKGPGGAPTPQSTRLKEWFLLHHVARTDRKQPMTSGVAPGGPGDIEQCEVGMGREMPRRQRQQGGPVSPCCPSARSPTWGIPSPPRLPPPYKRRASRHGPGVLLIVTANWVELLLCASCYLQPLMRTTYEEGPISILIYA